MEIFLTHTLPLDAAAVAELLREIGTRLELSGEAPFKTRAYAAAADSLTALTCPLADCIAQGRLRTLAGVGEALAEKILKLHKTGSHPTLEYLREQMPAGVLDLLKVQGLGPKKALVLFREKQIDSLNSLEAACRAGALTELKGFGAKVQAGFLKHLEQLKSAAKLCLIDESRARAATACALLLEHFPALRAVHPAGEARRCCEVSSGTTLAASCADAAQSREVEAFAKASGFAVVTGQPETFGAALLFATGSDAHCLQLCARATGLGMTLSPQGLTGPAGPLSCRSEEEIYAALGLSFIEPELREGRSEFEAPVSGKLVCEADLRGILHCHTVFSDGLNSLAEMADGARALGARYFGVCDHSQSAAYAGGLKIEKVRAQHALADEFNARHDGSGFRIFKGIESDILQDGAIDYPPDQLAEFDFIVASVHSRFTLSKQEQTARIVRAVENPFTTILGHPTGRLLLKREGYEVDLDTVLAACARHGVAVEINAHPNRLDLDWRWHARALELGCLFAINPDAHDVPELQMQKWGVSVARKGGVPSQRVLNCLELDALSAHFAQRKKLALAGG